MQRLFSKVRNRKEYIPPLASEHGVVFSLQVPDTQAKQLGCYSLFYVLLYQWEIFWQPKYRGTVNTHIVNSASVKPNLTY